MRVVSGFTWQGCDHVACNPITKPDRGELVLPDTINIHNGRLMFAHRLRRRPSINPTLVNVQC